MSVTCAPYVSPYFARSRPYARHAIPIFDSTWTCSKKPARSSKVYWLDSKSQEVAAQLHRPSSRRAHEWFQWTKTHKVRNIDVRLNSKLANFIFIFLRCDQFSYSVSRCSNKLASWYRVNGRGDKSGDHNQYYFYIRHDWFDSSSIVACCQEFRRFVWHARMIILYIFSLLSICFLPNLYM